MVAGTRERTGVTVGAVLCDHALASLHGSYTKFMSASSEVQRFIEAVLTSSSIKAREKWFLDMMSNILEPLKMHWLAAHFLMLRLAG